MFGNCFFQSSNPNSISTFHEPRIWLHLWYLHFPRLSSIQTKYSARIDDLLARVQQLDAECAQLRREKEGAAYRLEQFMQVNHTVVVADFLFLLCVLLFV